MITIFRYLQFSCLDLLLLHLNSVFVLFSFPRESCSLNLNKTSIMLNFWCILPQSVHSSCHICWGARGSGFSLWSVSRHRSLQSEAPGLWPRSSLREQQSTRSAREVSANADSLFCKKERELTFDTYITFDERTKNSSYPPGRAGDSRQGELLRCCLHLDGWQTPAVLSQAGENDSNQTKFWTVIIHLQYIFYQWFNPRNIRSFLTRGSGHASPAR